jgi:nitrogen-specific signal transduction histidine kinase
MRTSFGKDVVFDCFLSRFEVMGEAHLLFVAMDAAPRKQLENQLLHSQKMESIGRLAGGIAHDFNNLLTPILGYAELLKLKSSGESHPELDRIMEAADKARVLTQQLLSFGRKQILEMKVIDVNRVLSRFYEILRRTIRENIEIGLHLTQYVYGVRADANQLEQIVLNLAINAQDAIEGNGRITIETAAVTLDEEYVQQHPEVTPGDYLMIALSDSGSGMDLPTLNKIFEPFFTTKTVGKGTGLGLAMVHGLVKQHEGHIWVYSEPGKGSVFKIYLPIVESAPVDAVPPQAPRAQLCAGGSTILLVEDNEMVRSLVFALLNSSGYRVLVASGPKEALQLARGERIDLLLTDVVMPDMTGPQLYEELLKKHPESKVLYMSGYTNNVIVHHATLNEGVNFIQKPFAVKDLAHKIESILSA